ncbi:MAG: hypothetical protein ABI867_18665 [Kofleriaceae bacterium]
MVHPNRFERVYTMTDYYDGPRCGIADFDGRPHLYSSPFEEHQDAYSDLFELRAVDPETLALALEDWEIWLRWETAFHAGEVTTETHPALPADRQRHDELAPMLEARLAALPGPVVRARGEFRPQAGHADGGRGRWLEVKWTVVTGSATAAGSPR